MFIKLIKTSENYLVYFCNEIREGDCRSFNPNPTALCIGKQSCLVLHASTKLPECNNTEATYLQVEYDCVPSKLHDKAFFEILFLN